SPLRTLLAAADRESAQAPVVGDHDRDVDPVAVNSLQRGHAAACREQRRAHRAGIPPAAVHAATLEDPSEQRKLNAAAGRRRGENDLFVNALIALGDAVEDWIRRCPVTPTVDEDITVTHASRLFALRAVIIVLAAGLRQLGASAPERI
ncbi:DALR anticodon binding domain-containing protein, partial [Brevibacterium aurantiacum]